VTKTTIYLPDDLKRGIELEAARREVSEAEVIREAVRQLIGELPRPKPRGGIFSGGLIDSARVDDYLAGFGEQ